MGYPDNAAPMTPGRNGVTMAETPADTAPIRAILLIPATGDPLGLLREGPCRARPPIASQVPTGEALPCEVCGGSLTFRRSRTDRLAPMRWFCDTSKPSCGFEQDDVVVLGWVAGDQGGNDYSRKALALVLAWEGEPVREGMVRAIVALATAEDLGDEIDTGVVPLWRAPDVLDEPGWWLECPDSVVRYVATEEAAQSAGTRHVPTIEDWPADMDDRLVPAWTLGTALTTRLPNGIARMEVVRG